ncbi:Uncharacterised protein [Listeria ivanovii subsp. londoniensis]|uniref:Secreted protein n=1 Tax=Listeria ivanovii TaxID=1638 RepID=A0AAX2DQA0_LISIV|nr:putative secreted protein [Listeria ivanovii]EFR96714.1 putative secreted protein [Listeria ivanovii FSL F6-596]SDW86879.1 hypothetical protein SAMN05421782_107139 [Listeria ivanovii]VEH46838.1 Uncharacterised protein [Listeria ivanovii subsp. londoniensis]
MKKWLLVVLTLALGLSLAACSGSNSSDKKEDTKKSETTNVKDDVLNYYMSLVDVIDTNNADYNAYVAAVGADPKPGEAELAALAKPASESALKVSETLASQKTPDLGKYTDDFKTAVEDLSIAYKQESDALKASGRDTTKADEAMSKADEAIANVLKEAGLNPSSITTDTAS